MSNEDTDTVTPKERANERTRSKRFSPFPRAEAYGLRRANGNTIPAPPATQPIAPPAAPSQAQPAHHIDVESAGLLDVHRRERYYRRSLACADACAAAVSVLVTMVWFGGYGLRPEFLLVMPLIVIVAKLESLYDHDELVIRKSTLDEFPRLLNLATLFALLIWLVRHYVVLGAPTTALLVGLWVLLIVLLFSFRVIARAFAGRHSSIERCLFVGKPAVYSRLQTKLAEERHVELVGSVGIEKVVSDLSVLRSLAKSLSVHRIIISTAGGGDPDATMDLVRGAKATGLRVSILPNVLAAVGSSVAFDDLGGMPLLGVPRFGLSRSSTWTKRALDLFGAVVGLVFLAPALACIAVLIKADSRGPILFRQTRIGRDGKPFQMLKFRTMVDGADRLKPELLDRNEAPGLFKIAADPRITRVGRFLRKVSIDEAPQLLNVLHGSMSLVGPRPLVLDEDQRITGFDRRRLQLTPGITGRWQILGSARIPLSEMVKIDYLYVANWSLWEDIKILIQTVGFVAARRGL
jgi:exopolysaccharide biosynthesis polyprenyl glycosylphosphotransferase